MYLNGEGGMGCCEIEKMKIVRMEGYGVRVSRGDL